MEIENKKLWDELQGKYQNNKVFRNELTELIRFWGSKLIPLVDSDEDSKLSVSELLEECILGQYFQGYSLMKKFIELDQLENTHSFDAEFWNIPPGQMLNQIGDVMSFLFGEEWAYHEGLTDYNLKMMRYIKSGYEIYREMVLEIANLGAYKAVIESTFYCGLDNKNDTDTFLLGDYSDIQFLNPQVYMQAQYYTEQHEIWDLFRIANGKKQTTWYGTIHLCTIPLEEGKEPMYLLNFSIDDSVRLDEKSRILLSLSNKLPDDIRTNIQIRAYHLSNLEVLSYNNEDSDAQVH